jgi:hypothetical protein
MYIGSIAMFYCRKGALSFLTSGEYNNILAGYQKSPPKTPSLCTNPKS